MDTHAQELAETYVKMLNTHDPDLVDQFVAEDYVNHNAFVADGREANRQFWRGFFVGLPDVSASMEDLVIAGDRAAGRFRVKAFISGSSWLLFATDRVYNEMQLHLATDFEKPIPARGNAMKRKSLENAVCPVARSLEAVGDAWSMLIVRQAFAGDRRSGRSRGASGWPRTS